MVGVGPARQFRVAHFFRSPLPIFPLLEEKFISKCDENEGLLAGLRIGSPYDKWVLKLLEHNVEMIIFIL